MDIDEGEAVVLTARFRDKDNNPVDPSTPVEVVVKDPNGNQTTGTASKTASGKFEFNYTPMLSGTHTYRFKSADGGIEADSFKANLDTTK